MISETLAGTNAGMSEAGLSDTSSSNSKPPNGADHTPRQGWWKKRGVEKASGEAVLTQIGGEGVLASAKTATPDVVAHASSATSSFSMGGGGTTPFVKTKIKM